MKTKVVLAKCSNYGLDDIKSALEKVLSGLGGLSRFVSPGERVLIKPNLLAAREPDRAVTTHPEIARALIRAVKQCGAVPVVADSAAGAVHIKDVWEKTGFLKLCAEESVELINLEHAGAEGFEVDGMRFSIAKPVLEADMVINVPKLKTHVLTMLTNAVKNVYGTMPGCQKTMHHKRYTHPSRFGEFLATLYSRVRPGLTICDAVVGMDGDGPAGGRPVRLGFVAGSLDGVALDSVMCSLLGIEMGLVPYLQELRRRGIGECDAGNIDVIGNGAENLSLPSFRLPNTFIKRMIPEWLLDIIRPLVWARPHFTEQCTSCGICVNACPVSALSMREDNRPELEGDKCIECFCCHEMCPSRAVEIKQGFITRLFLRGRFPAGSDD